jgi:nitronate monooxygenase
MAAAVSDACGLGSLGLGNLNASTAQALIHDLRSRTSKPFNVNLFCHKPAVSCPEKEAAWLKQLTSQFERFDARPPEALREIYKSFLVDDEMASMVLQERPAVVSFHFGAPSRQYLKSLKDAGIHTLATATSVAEAEHYCSMGIDAVIAQGYEAGGHRGVLDPSAPDEHLTTIALTRLLVKSISVPVIAAGGIMDGAGIAAALALGAQAVQLGTAFVPCPESAADEGYRKAILSRPAHKTVMTTAISGRPARSLENKLTALGSILKNAPDYPIAYDASKALNAHAKTHGDNGYAAQWAGQGVALTRNLPAVKLVEQLWT